MAGHKWAKGTSGNPGGRKRMPDDLRAACKRLALIGMKGLEEIITGKNADGSPRSTLDTDRIRATKLMMEYGFGKPVQPVEGNGEGGAITVVIRQFPEE